MRKPRNVGEGKKKLSVGKRGEEVATGYLTRLGYEILERNWRGVGGEIDIIARDGGTLVFVEVRTRSRAAPTDPTEWFPAVKRRKLVALAAAYPRGVEGAPVRIDVIGVVLGPDGPRVTHLRAAVGEGGA